MSSNEIAKRSNVLRRSIPSRCKGLSFTSPKFCVLIPSRSMPFAENISIVQERSGGAVRVCVDVKKFPVFKVLAF